MLFSKKDNTKFKARPSDVLAFESKVIGLPIFQNEIIKLNSDSENVNDLSFVNINSPNNSISPHLMSNIHNNNNHNINIHNIHNIHNNNNDQQQQSLLNVDSNLDANLTYQSLSRGLQHQSWVLDPTISTVDSVRKTSLPNLIRYATNSSNSPSSNSNSIQSVNNKSTSLNALSNPNENLENCNIENNLNTLDLDEKEYADNVRDLLVKIFKNKSSEEIEALYFEQIFKELVLSRKLPTYDNGLKKGPKNNEIFTFRRFPTRVEINFKQFIINNQQFVDAVKRRRIYFSVSFKGKSYKTPICKKISEFGVFSFNWNLTYHDLLFETLRIDIYDASSSFPTLKKPFLRKKENNNNNSNSNSNSNNSSRDSINKINSELINIKKSESLKSLSNKECDASLSSSIRLSQSQSILNENTNTKNSNNNQGNGKYHIPFPKNLPYKKLIGRGYLRFKRLTSTFNEVEVKIPLYPKKYLAPDIETTDQIESLLRICSKELATLLEKVNTIKSIAKSEELIENEILLKEVNKLNNNNNNNNGNGSGSNINSPTIPTPSESDFRVTTPFKTLSINSESPNKDIPSRLITPSPLNGLVNTTPISRTSTPDKINENKSFLREELQGGNPGPSSRAIREKVDSKEPIGTSTTINSVENSINLDSDINLKHPKPLNATTTTNNNEKSLYEQFKRFARLVHNNKDIDQNLISSRPTSPNEKITENKFKDALSMGINDEIPFTTEELLNAIKVSDGTVIPSENNNNDDDDLNSINNDINRKNNDSVISKNENIKNNNNISSNNNIELNKTKQPYVINIQNILTRTVPRNAAVAFVTVKLNFSRVKQYGILQPEINNNDDNSSEDRNSKEESVNTTGINYNNEIIELDNKGKLPASLVTPDSAILPSSNERTGLEDDSIDKLNVGESNDPINIDSLCYHISPSATFSEEQLKELLQTDCDLEITENRSNSNGTTTTNIDIKETISINSQNKELFTGLVLTSETEIENKNSNIEDYDNYLITSQSITKKDNDNDNFDKKDETNTKIQRTGTKKKIDKGRISDMLFLADGGVIEVDSSIKDKHKFHDTNHHIAKEDDKLDGNNSNDDLIIEEEKDGRIIKETKAKKKVSFLAENTVVGLKEVSQLAAAFLSSGWNINKIALMRSLLLVRKYQTRYNPNNRTNKLVLSKTQIKTFLYFIKYDVASYGSLAANYFGHGKGYIRDTLRSKADSTTAREILGIPKEDLLVWDYELKMFKPMFYIARDRSLDALVISIRGTFNLHEIITDAYAEYAPFSHGHAHHGFLKCARTVEVKYLEKIKSWIKEFKCKRLYLCGHSMGGGVATLLTMILKSRYNELVECSGRSDFVLRCYNVATPPCVNEELCKEYEDVIETVVNENDIVPRLSWGGILDLRDLVYTANKLLNDHTLNDTERLKKLRLRHLEIKALDLHPKVYIPGKVYYVYKNSHIHNTITKSITQIVLEANDEENQKLNKKKKNHSHNHKDMPKRENTGNSLIDYEEPHFLVEESDAKLFTDPQFKNNFFYDHFLNRYESALLKAGEFLSENNTRSLMKEKNTVEQY